MGDAVKDVMSKDEKIGPVSLKFGVNRATLKKHVDARRAGNTVTRRSQSSDR